MSTIFDLLTQPGTATIVAACLSVFFGANVHFFRWLGSKFEKLSEKLESMGKDYRTMLDIHEGRDQQRHEENLIRFQEINVSLARLEENVENTKKEIEINGNSLHR